MAPDPPDSGEGSDDDGPEDDERIRSIVREEMTSFVDGLTDLGGGGDDDDDDDAGGDAPVTMAGVEAAMESKVQAAMEPLRADIAKLTKGPGKPKAAAAKPKPEPEPTPQEPRARRLLEKLWS